jgi:hypothetical protein
MTMGKTGLLQYTQKADWLKCYLQSLAALFFKLEAHELCKYTRGPKIHILYQAHICFEWHEVFKHGCFFDISNINEQLLQEISDEVQNIAQESGIEHVSPPPLLIISSITIWLIFPMLYLYSLST